MFESLGFLIFLWVIFKISDFFKKKCPICRSTRYYLSEFMGFKDWTCPNCKYTQRVCESCKSTRYKLTKSKENPGHRVWVCSDCGHRHDISH